MGVGPKEDRVKTAAVGPAGVRRRAVSPTSVVIVVLALPILCAVLYYWPQVRSYVVLERWSDTGPRRTVGLVRDAIASNDQAGLAAALGGRTDVAVTTENGELSALKLGGGPAPPVATWPLRLPTAQVRTVEYDLSGGTVAVRVRGDEGPEVLFVLDKPQGKWRVVQMMGPPVLAAQSPPGDRAPQ